MWRNQGVTGSNNIPLGSRRRFGDGEAGPYESEPQREPQRGRARSPVRELAVAGM